MDKTLDGRLSHPYIEGVNAFINFAKAVVDLSGNILCPCIHCVNGALFFTCGMYRSFFLLYKSVVEINVLFKCEILIM